MEQTGVESGWRGRGNRERKRGIDRGCARQQKMARGREERPGERGPEGYRGVEGWGSEGWRGAARGVEKRRQG